MIDLSDYVYDLPPGLIAQKPLARKEAARLMVLGRETMHRKFSDILEYLHSGDVLVINTTKVMPSRLVGSKYTGSRVEITLTSSTPDPHVWQGHIKANHPRIGMQLQFPHHLSAVIINISGDVYTYRFNTAVTPAYLRKYGTLPFPTYVRRPKVTPREYQTIYAQQEGSVAAPTAGLHFSRELIAKIKKRGIKIAKVCLHVSYGTFLPVRKEMFVSRKMRPEYVIIDKKTCDIINNRKGRLFVVGTTSLKALESAANAQGVIHPFNQNSELFIFPGYKFKTRVDGFITNFHLPRSSLLLLVSAFYGRKRILAAYLEAIRLRYRFYSFGDAMLILRKSMPRKT